MQDKQLLLEGLALMGVGMGFVFVFLTILVLVTTLMSMLVRRLTPVPEPLNSATAPSSSAPHEDAALMAAIGAAVHRYRRRQR